LTMASGDECLVLALHEGITGYNVVRVNLEYNGSNYRVRAGCVDDSNVMNYTGYHNIAAADWTEVQIRWYAGHYTGKNNGFLMVYIDGTLKEVVKDLNNHSVGVDKIRLGTIAEVDAGTSGTLYFDNLTVDWLRYIEASEPNSITPPAEVYTVTVVTTVVVTVNI